MSTFEQFNLQNLSKKAIDDLGFTSQLLSKKNFFCDVSGRDMMGIAQTGTGKTFAYLFY
jgi:ATP-dependent RNA helicase RhlE